MTIWQNNKSRGLSHFNSLEVCFNKSTICFQCMGRYTSKTAGWNYFPKPDAANKRKTSDSFSFLGKNHTFLQLRAFDLVTLRTSRLIGSCLFFPPLEFTSCPMSHPITVNQLGLESRVQSGWQISVASLSFHQAFCCPCRWNWRMCRS